MNLPISFFSSIATTLVQGTVISCLDHWALPIQPRLLDAFILLLSLSSKDINHFSVPPVWQVISCLRAFALAILPVGNVLSSSPPPSSFIACLHLHIRSLFKYLFHKEVFPDSACHLTPIQFLISQCSVSYHLQHLRECYRRGESPGGSYRIGRKRAWRWHMSLLCIFL